MEQVAVRVLRRLQDRVNGGLLHPGEVATFPLDVAEDLVSRGVVMDWRGIGASALPPEYVEEVLMTSNDAPAPLVKFVQTASNRMVDGRKTKTK